MTIFLARRSYGLIPAQIEKTDTDQNKYSNGTQKTTIIDISSFPTSHITLHEANTAVTEMNLPSSLAVLPRKFYVTVTVTADQQIARTA